MLRAVPAILALALFCGCSDSKSPPRTDAEEGGILFSRLGCAACHRPGAAGRPLDGITARKSYSWFEAYVRNPLAFNPSTTMPRYRLASAEMRSLWAYLRQRDGSTGAAETQPVIPFEKDLPH